MRAHEVGQVVRYKIEGPAENGYSVRDIHGNQELLHKRFAPRRRLVRNQFIPLYKFVDKDGSVHLTPKIPHVLPGRIGALTVLLKTDHGFFLDNGSERDVFLPMEEKTAFLEPEDVAIVKVSPDPAQPAATMKFIYKQVTPDDYKIGQHIPVTVIERIKKNTRITGVKCVTAKDEVLFVNREDLDGVPRLNETVDVRITAIREDGRMNGATRSGKQAEKNADVDIVIKFLVSESGSSPITDKSDPALIRERTGLSKKAFKSAVGVLIATGRAEIRKHQLRLIDS